jgi:two-component system chemotaxis response regulator CheY
MIDLEDELAERYLTECQEHLDTLETQLVALENSGADADEEGIKCALRAVHSIKGEASLFDLIKVGELAAQMEDALAPVRFRQMPITQERVSALLRATERLQHLIQDPSMSNRSDISETMASLASLPRDLTHTSQASAATSPALSSLRMLLVEDDFTSRLLLQTFLSRYGNCHIAVNGREAVEAFRSAQERGEGYDLICMDIMMPEMDGQQALQQIRALEERQGVFCNRGAKIVMTTTVAQVKQVVGCFRELCDSYLLKPVDLAKLLSLMKSYELIP